MAMRNIDELNPLTAPLEHNDTVMISGESWQVKSDPTGWQIYRLGSWQPLPGFEPTRSQAGLISQLVELAQ
jgi:hypothetical protein